MMTEKDAFQVVYEKICASPMYQRNSEASRISLANSVSTPEGIIETYLYAFPGDPTPIDSYPQGEAIQFKFVDPQEEGLVQMVARSSGDQTSSKKSTNINEKSHVSSNETKTHSSPVHNSSNHHLDNDVEWRYFERVDEDSEFEKRTWKIQFLLSGFHAEESLFDRIHNSVVSTSLSYLSLLPDYGVFHTALIIGPHKFEWIDSNLCIPRNPCATNPMLLVTISEVRDAEHYDQLRRIVAERIVHWNTTKYYSQKALPFSSGPNFGNCHDFVDDLLFHLGLREQLVEKLKAIHPIWEETKHRGQKCMYFKPSRSFFERYPITPSCIEKQSDGTYTVKLKKIEKKGYSDMSISFNSHRDIDLYIHALLHLDKDILKKNYNEIEMIRCLDRAFWLQKKKHEIIQNKDPTHIIPDDCMESSHTCPFLPPALTNTIVDMPDPRYGIMMQRKEVSI